MMIMSDQMLGMGPIRSDNERVMIIGGYSPLKHKAMGGQWSDACV